MAAVCVACGAMKIGAWTPCTTCKHDATTDTGRARALLLSDRMLDRAGLAAASAAIQAGEPPPLDETKVAEIAAGIAHAPVPSRIGMTMLVIGFLLLVGAVGLMLVLVIRWLISLAA